ncbi:hypothetical protein [Lentilactobacillus sp. SPB1-3]|uniref:Uncharacterized protein n=1 Tax=Lentilactobacillus terminaliae TaxID=3003483 RepID=A0ACD5DDM3_9LACO|nr:hypothetical protein [Lentilactobacillus sp. SPB1-3]MCZ0977701.1 hypothetical protein [Lentilactobacillus sp. SPB1-3]
MNLNNLSLANLFLAAVIIIRVIMLQLQPKIIKFSSTFYLLMIIFGVYEGIKIKDFHLTTGFIWFVILALISTVLFAYFRVISYHLWVDDYQLVMRQGTWITLVLWIIGIGPHMLIDNLWAQSNVVILVHLGLTLMIQRGIVWRLATRQFLAEIQTTTAYNDKYRHERREDHEHRHNRNR